MKKNWDKYPILKISFGSGSFDTNKRLQERLDALYTDFEDLNRQELRNFYSPLKDLDKCIKSLFITGITKVSHVNIFSGLNQLNDISLNKDFSTLCGISESELENYFSEEISKLAVQQEMSVSATKQKLAEMYDGYPFTHDCESVYIFELKMNKGRAYQSVLSEALTQIDKNG